MTKPSYTKEMRQYADEHDMRLVTVDIPGMCFQGPADKDFVKVLAKALTAEFKKRAKRNKGTDQG